MGEVAMSINERLLVKTIHRCEDCDHYVMHGWLSGKCNYGLEITDHRKIPKECPLEEAKRKL